MSLLPLSHSLEQIVSPVLRDGRRRGHPVRPEPEPAGHLRQPPRAPGHDDARSCPRCSTCSGARSSARSSGRAKAKQFERLRSIARRLPYAARRVLFRSVHAQLGGGLRLFATAGAFLPPALQQAWEDMGVIVLQGYGATETAAGSRDDDGRPPAGLRRAGRPSRSRCGSSRTARSSSAARRSPRATGTTPRRRPRPSPTTAGTSRATSGSWTTKGRLHLHGRKKDMIVLPNGFNVYPGGHRERPAGRRASATRWRSRREPGRIEVVVLAPGTHADPRDARATPAIEGAAPDDLRREIEAAVKAANASLGPNQRIRAGACGPRRTSRARTRSRSSATGCGPGRPSTGPGWPGRPPSRAGAA